ncbi:MAG TPA: hypothetical protein VMN79_00950 [Casimicrobiaceae bacterium]|nr:hypothetical protein [Casimicrobiaceae bacterium]
MKSLILGTVLLLIAAASLAETSPGAAAPPPTSGAANAPPGGNDSQPRSTAKASGNSCHKPALGTCKGCSITCNDSQMAVCGEALYNWNSNKCVRDAACRCKARRS